MCSCSCTHRHTHTHTHSLCLQSTWTYKHMHAHIHTDTHTHTLNINSVLHHQRQTLFHFQDTLFLPFPSHLSASERDRNRHTHTHTHTVHTHTHTLVWMQDAGRSIPSPFPLSVSPLTMTHSVTAPHFEVIVLLSKSSLASVGEPPHPPFFPHYWQKSSDSVLLCTDLIWFSEKGEVLWRSKALKMESSVKSFSLVFPPVSLFWEPA